MKERTAQLVNQEVIYDKTEELVSTTDLKGTITYANESFCRIAGYEAHELVGKNHNIVRHPDMPKAAFADLWDKIKVGEAWRGVVKNSCKDGRYYWVDAYVTPLYDNGEHIGYQSVRIMPSQALKDRASKIYSKINKGKSISPTFMSVKFRKMMAFILLLAFTFHIFTSNGLADALISISLIIAMLMCNFKELITTPRQLNQLTRRFDSPSRLVYEGSQPFDIAKFHIGLLQARIRTILGRTSDATGELSSLSEKLNDISLLTTQGVKEEEKELQQLAAAIDELSLTAKEIGLSTEQAANKNQRRTTILWANTTTGTKHH